MPEILKYHMPSTKHEASNESAQREKITETAKKKKLKDLHARKPHIFLGYLISGQ